VLDPFAEIAVRGSVPSQVTGARRNHPCFGILNPGYSCDISL
jgi:hypothetical protein